MKFSDDVYDAFGAASDEVFAETFKTILILRHASMPHLNIARRCGWLDELSDQAYIGQRNRVLGV